MLVASGYIGALGGVLERALTQLDAPGVRENLPDEIVAAVLDLAKAQQRASNALAASIGDVL